MRRDKIEKLATVLNVSPLEFLNLDAPQLSHIPLSDNLLQKLEEILAEAFGENTEDSFALIIKNKQIFLANSKTNYLKYILDYIK